MTTSRRLATIASLVVALAGLLPAPHAHLGRDNAIVHVHALADSPRSHHDDDPGHDHATFDHGDRANASTVLPSYDIAARFVLKLAAVAAAVAPEAPMSDIARLMSRAVLLPTHDPPLRYTSSPAPPAVV